MFEGEKVELRKGNRRHFQRLLQVGRTLRLGLQESARGPAAPRGKVACHFARYFFRLYYVTLTHNLAKLQKHEERAARQAARQ